MSTVAKSNEKKETKAVSIGMHPAVCIWVIDMGMQHNDFNDADQHKVYLQFETDEMIKIDGVDKPMVIGKQFTLSLHEKANLRKELESWRGKPFTKEEENGFDIKNVLDKPCILNVTHNVKGDRTYANIAAINPVMKGIVVAKAVNEVIHFDMDDPEREKVLAKLPNWMQDKIKASKTYAKDDAVLFGDFEPLNDEEMPF